MDEKELAKEYKETIALFETKHIQDVKSIIQRFIKPLKAKNVNKKLDVNGKSGFYMIFCSNEPKDNNCLCRIECRKTTFFCVYRGHSSSIQNRVTKHLFFDSSINDNCMRIKLNGNRYNINIESQALFENNSLFPDTFPNWKWKYIKIEFDSKQGLREIYEKAFDELYNRPSFSDK